jgi:hypothetical protein
MPVRLDLPLEKSWTEQLSVAVHSPEVYRYCKLLL